MSQPDGWRARSSPRDRRAAVRRRPRRRPQRETAAVSIDGISTRRPSRRTTFVASIPRLGRNARARRPRLRAAVRAGQDRRRARHAAFLAFDGESRDRRGSRRWGPSDRHRARRRGVYLAVGHLGLDGGIQSPPRTTRRVRGHEDRPAAAPVGGDSGIWKIQTAPWPVSTRLQLDPWTGLRGMSFRPTSTRSCPSSTPRR